MQVCSSRLSRTNEIKRKIYSVECTHYSTLTRALNFICRFTANFIQNIIVNFSFLILCLNHMHYI